MAAFLPQIFIWGKAFIYCSSTDPHVFYSVRYSDITTFIRLQRFHTQHCKSLFSEMKIAQISCKQRYTLVWAIQVLLWWREDLASQSTAAHATLNTPHSPCTFLTSDIRVKQTKQASEIPHFILSHQLSPPPAPFFISQLGFIHNNTKKTQMISFVRRYTAPIFFF